MESKTNRTIKKYLEKYTTDSNPDPDGKIIPDPVQLSESGTIIMNYSGSRSDLSKKFRTRPEPFLDSLRYTV